MEKPPVQNRVYESWTPHVPEPAPAPVAAPTVTPKAGSGPHWGRIALFLGVLAIGAVVFAPWVGGILAFATLFIPWRSGCAKPPQ